MKTTAQRQVKTKERSYVASSINTHAPCDIEIMLNNRKTVALSKRGGLFVLDDPDSLQATEAALRVTLGKVERLIKAGGAS